MNRRATTGLAADLFGTACAGAAGIACYLAFPTSLSLLTGIIALALLVLSLDLVTGQGGVATLGQAALFGCGAYAAGIAAVHFDVRDPMAMLIVGALAGALAGLATGAAVLRCRGLAQLVLSIALAQLLFEAANRASAWTGGSDGLYGIDPDPLFGIWRFDLFGRTAFWLGLSILLAVAFALRRLMRSPFGLLVGAIRQDETRVEARGARPYPALLKLYAIAGSVAGLGGGLSAVSTRVVGLDSLSFQTSAEALVMMVLGGAGSVWGALVGAVAFLLFEHFVSAVDPFHWLTLVGLMLILVVLFAPRGLYGSLAALGARRLR